MKTVSISLNTVDKVRSFVNTVDRLDCGMDIVSESMVIDAKSIMGILSIDLTKPLELAIHGSDEESEKAMHVLEQYIA